MTLKGIFLTRQLTLNYDMYSKCSSIAEMNRMIKTFPDHEPIRKLISILKQNPDVDQLLSDYITRKRYEALILGAFIGIAFVSFSYLLRVT